MREGCPCGTQGKCCDKPETYTPDHDHSIENVCEDCYCTGCRNCGKRCYCEL